MKWQTDDWKQDDSVFYGYPIPTGSESPGVIDKLKLPAVWNCDDAFYSYPHVTDSPGVIDKSKLPTIWIFDDAFYGYPHTANLVNNPINLMYGRIPVQSAYLGTELIWKRGGINRIMTGNLIINHLTAGD